MINYLPFSKKYGKWPFQTRLVVFLVMLALLIKPERLAQAAVPPPDDTFAIAVLPDTQNYIQNLRGIASRQMFRDQIDWIVANRNRRKISYVTQLGDLSQCINMAKRTVEEGLARETSAERFRACDSIMRPLDRAGIPYGIAVGNHDQFPLAGDATDNSTDLFHTWFINQGGSRSRFDGKSFFGGTREEQRYDDHFDRFTAGGKWWIVIYLEFDDDQQRNTADDDARNRWARSLLQQYANHTGIVVTHNAGKLKDKAFSRQGQRIYNTLKAQPNFVMMLGGHIANLQGDVNYFRTDRGALPPVRTYVSDFQSLSADGTVAGVNGGNGYLRLMEFSVRKNTVKVSTFSPYLEKRNQPNQFAGLPDHQFQKPIFGGAE